MVGVSALSLGMGMALLSSLGWLRSPSESGAGLKQDADTESTAVLELALLSPQQRSDQLQAMAQAEPGLNQYRARYLLAVDLLAQGRALQALKWLQDLESAYGVLAPYVLQTRARAQRAAGQSEAAQETWQQLQQTYGDDPAAAEALYQLGRHDQLLQQFPAHPRSVEVALERLSTATSPEQIRTLLLLVARHGLHRPEAEAILNRLVNEFGASLRPEDWQAIGFGYWKKDIYGQAGSAYAQAPATPTTLYRAARGLQIGQRRQDAIATYRRLEQTFPQAPETAQGLLHLASLLPAPEALPVLDRVIKRFPQRAAEALLQRAERLAQLNSPTSAAQARQSLLNQYPEADATLALRLTRAKAAATQQNWQAAIDWVAPIAQANLPLETAAEAIFWQGKWSLRAGRSDQARQLFEQVVNEYPQSYFAWRSAVALGWNVGDFTTLRYQQPPSPTPSRRGPLPAGSAPLEELYRLGQDRLAWRRWQVELPDPQQLTVDDQFTDGLMRLGSGDHLDGIYQLTSLDHRDGPQAQARVQQLQQTPDYWHGLYPLLFSDLIAHWSQQRQLNPLLVTALIRQESRFEPQIRSFAGAVGLMQVMPATADWIRGQIGLPEYRLDQPEDNVKLGTWYLDYTHREYDDHSLFAVASYNAGPGNVASWIRRGGFQDADEFAEQIPFPETKGYVEAVFGGYWNYLRLHDPALAQLSGINTQVDSSSWLFSHYNTHR